MMENKQLIVLSDILKSEADINSRIAVSAPQGTKLGDVVKYEPRNQYLIALSDEVHGVVMVQPHQCTICLDKVVLPSDVSAETLMQQGDAYGIKYIGTATNSETPAVQPLATELDSGTNSGLYFNPSGEPDAMPSS